jgi:signal transduction histidine kinase
MLKQEAENATKDKLNLKEYISDISHQLKTPLTSILIMLDNIIDDEDMDSEVREEFVRSIKRDIGNINKLVQILLKLSRLETNTVKFLKKEICIQNILDEVLQNVESISDLKDVKIEVRGNNEYTINCDQMWQVEAITNIVKNAIEHSNEGSKVLVDLEDNNVYSSVSVTNYGVSISEEDRANIFKRFYKGKNQSKDSVGIGLALAKSIVENDSGRISVESLENGVRFSIKYFKM